MTWMAGKADPSWKVKLIVGSMWCCVQERGIRGTGLCSLLFLGFSVQGKKAIDPLPLTSSDACTVLGHGLLYAWRMWGPTLSLMKRGLWKKGWSSLVGVLISGGLFPSQNPWPGNMTEWGLTQAGSKSHECLTLTFCFLQQLKNRMHTIILWLPLCFFFWDRSHVFQDDLDFLILPSPKQVCTTALLDVLPLSAGLCACAGNTLLAERQPQPTLAF